MYYKKDSIIMNYLKRFYDSSLFMALLVASLVLMLYLAMLDATALQVAVPAKGATAPLQVQPVSVTSLDQINTPSDIQPVTIPDVLQSTTNPQR